MTPEELRKTPTESEVADLVAAAESDLTPYPSSIVHRLIRARQDLWEAYAEASNQAVAEQKTSERLERRVEELEAQVDDLKHGEMPEHRYRAEVRTLIRRAIRRGELGPWVFVESTDEHGRQSGNLTTGYREFMNATTDAVQRARADASIAVSIVRFESMENFVGAVLDGIENLRHESIHAFGRRFGLSITTQEETR